MLWRTMTTKKRDSPPQRRSINHSGPFYPYLQRRRPPWRQHALGDQLEQRKFHRSTPGLHNRGPRHRSVSSAHHSYRVYWSKMFLKTVGDPIRVRLVVMEVQGQSPIALTPKRGAPHQGYPPPDLMDYLLCLPHRACNANTGTPQGAAYFPGAPRGDRGFSSSPRVG